MSDRKAARIDIVDVLHGEVLVPQQTVITQISRTGMRVETTFPLHLNALHDFRLTLGGRSVVVKGRVVHARISEVDRDAVRYLSGIEFVELSPSVAAVIGRYIDVLQRQRITLRKSSRSE
jgi:hypothetical protein